MVLKKLSEKLKHDNGNPTLHFEIAEAYFEDGKNEEMRNHIRKGLEVDFSNIPLLEVFDEALDDEIVISYIIPKRGVYSKGMILDGTSFYSNLLEGVIEHLLSQKRVNIILSLNNVSYFADFGDAMINGLRKKIQQAGGDIVCVNLHKLIQISWETIGKDAYPQFFNTSIEAVDYFKKFKTQPTALPTSRTA